MKKLWVNILILVLFSFNAKAAVILKCILSDGKHLTSSYKEQTLYLTIDKESYSFNLSEVTNTYVFGAKREYISVNLPNGSVLYRSYDGSFDENYYEFGLNTNKKNKDRICKKVLKSDFDSIRNDSKEQSLE